MAAPHKFEGSNVTMLAPEGAADVVDVRAFQNDRFCITAWKLTAAEMEEVNRTGVIWLSVMGDGGMPPCFVGGERETREVSATGGEALPAQAATP